MLKDLALITFFLAFLGKTHTMLGGPDNPGFIQRAVSQIFESIPTFLEKDFLLRVSYMEIYNEQVTDLLSQV